MMRTLAGRGPWLRTVRRVDVDADEGPLRRLDFLAVDDDCRLAAQDEEDLLLVAQGLVVLGDAAARRDRDEVDAERVEPQRPPDEQPVAVPFAVIAVDERVRGHRL